MWEGNHKEFDFINCCLLPFPLLFTHTRAGNLPFTPAQLVDGKLGCVPERSWFTGRPLCNLSAGQGRFTSNPGQLRRAERRTHWAGCRQHVKMCENLPGRTWLSGGKGPREPRLTPQECKKKCILLWGNRLRWFEAETGQRAGKEGEEVSKNPIYCV